MLGFIIDPKEISPEGIRQSLLDYLESKPDHLRWKAFYESSAGQIIIDFIAGFVAFFVYHITVGRREAYLTHAENNSSHIAIAQNLSYSTFRGRNTIISVTFTATSQPIILNKWDVVGTAGDQEVIVLEDVTINTGFAREVNCIIGTVSEEIIHVNSSEIKPFRFVTSGMSEDIRLYHNNIELPYSTQLKELVSGKHIIISNALGAVDLYYLNNQAPFYNTGDEFKIRFVRLFTQEINIDEIGLFSGTNPTLISRAALPETNDAIKVNAPLYFETQYKLRGRNDFKKIFKTLDSTLVDTNGADYTPSIVELTYVKEDFTFLTQTEKNNFLDILSTDLPYGVIAPIMSDPMRAEMDVNVTLKYNRIVSENITQVVRDLLSPYESKLETTIDLEDIETSLAKLDYIKSARVSINITQRQDDSFYKRLDFSAETLSCDEPVLEFLSHIRRSGSIEPVWPLNEGDIIQDGRIFWEALDERTCNLEDWDANFNYSIGDKIKPVSGPATLIYICRYTENVTDGINPFGANNFGDIVYDGEIIWQVNPIITPITDIWAQNTNYRLGETIIPWIDADFCVSVVGFRSKSGAVPPVFPVVPNILVEDGEIQWISRDRTRSVFKTKWNEYLITKPSVQITNG